MEIIFPKKVNKKSKIRVITPARSLSLPWITREIIKEAESRLKKLGLEVTYGKHIREIDDFSSSPASSRVEDFHEAFFDDSIDLVLTVTGGYNSNEILPYLDYQLIRQHPKIFCGYSDITALSSALLARAGLVTYSGPHFFDFGEKKGFEFTEEYFKKCLFYDQPYLLGTSQKWSNDRWGTDQEKRNFFDNPGWLVINPGSAGGTLLGGNLVTWQALSGTPYFPSLDDSILFLEEDHEEDLYSFNRNLSTLSQRQDFYGVKAIVFGRFQSESKIDQVDLKKVVENNPILKKLPVIYGLDFGHTTPRITFPIGGRVSVEASEDKVKIYIEKH